MIDTKLRTLLSLANTKNYTETARELNLTQPAISHHIRLLEEEFHTHLFIRVKNKIKLTPEGEILLKYARRINALYDNAQAEIEACTSNVRHLTIGITQTVSEVSMPQIIAIYTSEHPGTQVAVVTDTIKNITSQLKLYKLDIAVVEGDVRVQDYVPVLLDTDSLCVIVSPQHPLAKRHSVTFEDIRGEKFILRSKRSGTRALFANYLDQYNAAIKNLNVTIEIDDVSVIRELVSLNMGISIVARSACVEDVQRGRLAVLDISDADMSRDINMLCHKDFAHPEILDDFREIYHRLYSAGIDHSTEPSYAQGEDEV
ncbi:MAG: LysR family transcriptional regulator [Clostridiaceae bacterium]|nr:LysR family transcriptional regulator [Clostridiales bacterium]MDD6877790.1 LysR family transcriptional regulator [Clostridiaceae bacterium]MDY3070700.1 LysR family transcriptional regulator [Eubacteriales bacterium]